MLPGIILWAYDWCNPGVFCCASIASSGTAACEGSALQCRSRGQLTVHLLDCPLSMLSEQAPNLPHRQPCACGRTTTRLCVEAWVTQDDPFAGSGHTSGQCSTYYIEGIPL